MANRADFKSWMSNPGTMRRTVDGSTTSGFKQPAKNKLDLGPGPTEGWFDPVFCRVRNWISKSPVT